MSKYSRYQSVIHKNSDESVSENYWLEQLNKLEKEAVQSKPIDTFLFDQINSIMNGKSKYPSVDVAVKDMQERSGLTAYLKKVNNNVKTASDNNSIIKKRIKLEPIVIKKNPNIKRTIENIIKSSNGNLPLPTILDKIKSIHKKDISEDKDWEDRGLLIFISGLNLEEKQKHPVNSDEYNLGKCDNYSSDDIDISNTDAFHSLNPAKV